MKINRPATLAVIFAMLAQPAMAEDDPTAATKAQTDLLTAQTAQINAQTAQINAQAARDKAQIDRLGLPSFENKTTLQEGGGAIETAMLSTRAVSKAADEIAKKVSGHCKIEAVDKTENSDVAINLTQSTEVEPAQIVVLAGNEQINLNAGRVMTARIQYFIDNLPPVKKSHSWNTTYSTKFGFESLPSMATAVAGLFGNETTVSGVGLPEVDDQFLANAVAGRLGTCAILPSVGAGIIDIDDDPIGVMLREVVDQRNAAQLAVQSSKAKAGSADALRIERLKSVILEFDEFYKAISTIGDDGQNSLMRAILADRIATTRGIKLLRVAINRAGGTITNSKNIGTFFGGDPVRVSGGLIASFVLVDAKSGQVLVGDSLACQTAQARLRDVQSGKWQTRDANGQKQALATAACS